ncbi:MAG: DUF3037 domain-containing protein [Abitibacteriaceae bacterium]|nr:DUF3037 domain-containing protein [Abditibacteriaceae bacterium]
MAEYVCNYALLRFLPYRDAGEFINIGIALACGPLGFLDFRIEMQRWARVSHFFPELEISTYRAGVHALCEECNRWKAATGRLAAQPPDKRETILRHIFGELTRPREALFHFGPPRTILSHAPGDTLDALFGNYVRRRFVTESLHGEEILRRQIADSLRTFSLDRFYKPARVGTPDYHVLLPFVAPEASAHEVKEPVLPVLKQPPLKAIKPLDLDRREPSEITQYGDEWLARVRRLRALEQQPREWLFVIRAPHTTPRAQHATDAIRRELEHQQVLTTTFDDTSSLIKFAHLHPNKILLPVDDNPSN